MFISRYRNIGEGRSRIVGTRITDRMETSPYPRLTSATQLLRTTGVEREHRADFSQKAALVPERNILSKPEKERTTVLNILGKPTKVPYRRLRQRSV